MSTRHIVDGVSACRRIGLWAIAALVAWVTWGASSSDAYVYWSDYGSGNIGRADLDGTSLNATLFAGASAPTGVAVSATHIYWANSRTGTIGVADMARTTVNQALITGASIPQGVAVDAAHVYWANFGAGEGTIGRANLDGSGVTQTFIDVGLVAAPDGVAVDGGHIYWTSFTQGKIGRANVDGTGVTLSLISGLGTPTGVAVDAGHIYWANGAAGTIGRANLDGTDVNQTLVAGAGKPEVVAVDAGHVYWANSASQAIGRANLDGTGATAHLFGAPNAYGLAVDALSSRSPLQPHCVVPQLRGTTLAAARRLLAGARCAVGRITRPHRRSRGRLVVTAQSPRAGATLAAGSPVGLRLRRSAKSA